MLLPVATASHTPNPTSVTIAGSLQSEAGCAGDWDPGCATTHLAYDAGDDVWQGTFTLPAGELRVQGGAERRLGRELRPACAVERREHPADPRRPARSVKFYYDHKSHWVDRQQELGDRGRRPAASSPSSAARATGTRLPAVVARRTPTATGSTRSRRRRCRGARTRRRSRSTRTGTRTTAPGGAPNGGEHRVHRPGRQREGHLHLRRRDARPDDHVRRSRRARGPGALSHFDLARKDCLGTARNTTSKVWYTVAGGVLSDVYYPTVDNTNVETLQYIVTDGSTFTDLQTRDMTYTVEAVNDTGGMACEVTATAKSGKYKIETDYITDPSRNTVLMRVEFKPLQRAACQLYVRFDPTVNGNGGGGRATAAPTPRPSTPRPAIRCSSPPTRSPRRTPPTATTRSRSSPPLTARSREASSGFAGAASDGLVQLDAAPRPDADLRRRRDGNVVADRAGRAQGRRQDRPRAGLRRHAGGGRRRRRGLARRRASTSARATTRRPGSSTTTR